MAIYHLNIAEKNFFYLSHIFYFCTCCHHHIGDLTICHRDLNWQKKNTYHVPKTSSWSCEQPGKLLRWLFISKNYLLDLFLQGPFQEAFLAPGLVIMVISVWNAGFQNHLFSMTVNDCHPIYPKCWFQITVMIHKVVWKKVDKITKMQISCLFLLFVWTSSAKSMFKVFTLF